MKKWVWVLVLAAQATHADWHPLKDTTELTCAEAATAVRRNGFQHYTVRGEPKLPLSSTFYADSRCDENFTASPALVPTLDRPLCFIGYTCSPADGSGQ